MRKLSLLITTLTLASITTGFAQNAQTGITFGGNLGAASTSAYNTDGLSNYTKTQGGLYGGINIGYDLALTQNVSLGLETGYYYGYELSSLKLGSEKSKINQWNIPFLIVGKYIFHNGANVFVKGGVAYVDQTVNTTANILSGMKETNHAFLPEVALGGGYLFQNGLSINGQLGYIFGSTAEIGKSDSISGNEIKVAASASLMVNLSYTLPI